MKGSAVLVAMGLAAEVASGSIRVSFGPSIAEADVDHHAEEDGVVGGGKDIGRGVVDTALDDLDHRVDRDQDAGHDRGNRDGGYWPRRSSS